MFRRYRQRVNIRYNLARHPGQGWIAPTEGPGIVSGNSGALQFKQVNENRTLLGPIRG